MLALERVGKTYPNGVHALEGVTLDVEVGEILAVVGGSGCGKSTLLRAICGLDEGASVRLSQRRSALVTSGRALAGARPPRLRYG